MSCYVIPAHTMNLVVSAWPELELGDQSRTLLGRALYLMNEAAFDARYGDLESPLASESYEYVEPTEANPKQQEEAISCLRYQCTEGAVPHSHLYKQLNAVRAMTVVRMGEWEEQQRQERYAAMIRKREEDQVLYSLGKAFLAEHYPNAKALIVGEERINESDLQTDYFGHSTGAVMVLAVSRHRRDLFPEMRKAAANYIETAHLGPGCDSWRVFEFEEPVKEDAKNDWRRSRVWRSPSGLRSWATKEDAETAVAESGEQFEYGFTLNRESVEHREKYSMGGGYYLGTGRHSGWIVEKTGIDDSAALIAIARGHHLLEPRESLSIPAQPDAPPLQLWQEPEEDDSPADFAFLA